MQESEIEVQSANAMRSLSDCSRWTKMLVYMAPVPPGVQSHLVPESQFRHFGALTPVSGISSQFPSRANASTSENQQNTQHFISSEGSIQIPEREDSLEPRNHFNPNTTTVPPPNHETSNNLSDFFPMWCHHGPGSRQHLIRKLDGFTPYVHEAIASSPATLSAHNEFVRKRKAASASRRKDVADSESGGSTDLLELVPQQAIAEPLIQLYMEFWESKYRNFHIPSFWATYHRMLGSPADIAPEFLAQLLLVLSLGLQLQRVQVANQDSDSSSAALPANTGERWLNAVESWLPTKGRGLNPSLDLVRLHCLLALPRRIHAIDAWFSHSSTGYLVRLATLMGLHRDLKRAHRISVFEAEMRRRLWATVMEIDIQMSLDRALMPLISEDMFDTEPPSNIDDKDIEETSPRLPKASAWPQYTDTSFQVILFQSLPVRLKVCNLINNPRASMTYEDVLKLDTELTGALSHLSSLLAIDGHEDVNIDFKRKRAALLDLHIRHSLLALHQAFATRATDERSHYYSRMVCLDSAAIFLLQHQNLVQGEIEASFIRSMALQSFILICFLLNQGSSGPASTSIGLNQASRSWLEGVLEKTQDACENTPRVRGRGTKECAIQFFMLAFIRSKWSPERCSALMQSASARYGDICRDIVRQFHVGSENINTPADSCGRSAEDVPDLTSSAAGWTATSNWPDLDYLGLDGNISLDDFIFDDDFLGSFS